VAATLNTLQGKGKQVVDQGEGTSSRFRKKKKNDKRRREDNFIAAVERKASRPKGNAAKPAPSRDHFEKLLDAPCPHHEVPVKHTLWECRLMKSYVKSTLKPKMADQSDKRGPSHDDDGGAGDVFPGEDGTVHMIFGESQTRPSRQREKLIRREVMKVDIASPSYMKWSKVPITFDRKDHPDNIPQPGSYPLVVAPLFKSRRIHKVLMDGGSGINVLYASTLDDMGMSRSALRPSTTPFHGIVPRIEALPLGQIDLHVTFGTCGTSTQKQGGVLGDVPCDPREAGIREVYGRAQLYVPEIENPRTEGYHHNQRTSTHTSATLSAFSSLKQRSGLIGSMLSLVPKTRMSPSRLRVRPALSSPPRMSRTRLSPLMAASSVSGQRSILNRKARSLTSSKRTSTCLHGNPPT
jgi:hypothetical protein